MRSRKALLSFLKTIFRGHYSRQTIGIELYPASLCRRAADVCGSAKWIELAGEGFYYYDVRRWGIAQTVLNGDIYNDKGERIDTRRFDPQRDNLWPIPAVAIQENTALKQNPGYRN